LRLTGKNIYVYITTNLYLSRFRIHNFENESFGDGKRDVKEEEEEEEEKEE